MCTKCYKLASDEARHRILSLLKKREMRVTDLVERLHVKQPTVTHHLKLLASAGLIRMKKEGRTHLYSLVTESECFSECGLLIGLK